jgi:hypothetical protein
MKNKKGVSVLIAYVLLIMIAVSLSFGVYFSLKRWIPEDRPECPAGVSLVIKSVECVNSEMTIIFENKGRFDIDGAYIIGESPGGDISLNPDSNSVPGKDGYFYFAGPNGLGAGSSEREVVFDEEFVHSISVQPFIRGKDADELILCTEAKFVKRNIQC